MLYNIPFMFRRFAGSVLILRWPLLLSLLLLAVVMVQAVLSLNIDPSMDTLLVKSSPEYRYYREYSKRYGSDKMIAVAMVTPNLFTPRWFRELKIITGDLSKFGEVERVLSLANARDIKHKFLGIKIVPAVESMEKEKLAGLREDILSNELFVNNLVSRDGKIANILIYLKSGEKQMLGYFFRTLHQYLRRHGSGVQFYMAGSPVEQYEFFRLIRHDQFTFVPLIAILLVLTTFVIYRSIPCMILAMSIVFLTLICTLGTIALTGQELNLMTSLLAPVIMIVAVINSIYLMNVFFEIRPRHPSLRQAVILTIAQLGIPCLLTHLTAILGFISLAVTPIPAIRSFGIFSALGTLYSFIFEMTLTPILLPMLPYRAVQETFNDRNFFNLRPLPRPDRLHAGLDPDLLKIAGDEFPELRIRGPGNAVKIAFERLLIGRNFVGLAAAFFGLINFFDQGRDADDVRNLGLGLQIGFELVQALEARIIGQGLSVLTLHDKAQGVDPCQMFVDKTGGNGERKIRLHLLDHVGVHFDF